MPCFESDDIGRHGTDLDIALNLITEMVKERYTVDPSQQVPMVFAFRDGEVSTIIQLDFDSDASKDLSIAQTRKIIHETGADASVFISEGWMVEHPRNAEYLVRPRDSERRIEVLIAQASGPGESRTATFEMIRDDQNNFVAFKPHSAGHQVIQSKMDFFN